MKECVTHFGCDCIQAKVKELEYEVDRQKAIVHSLMLELKREQNESIEAKTFYDSYVQRALDQGIPKTALNQDLDGFMEALKTTPLKNSENI